ncbi:MAG TPA: serine/threonine-protein kinase [Vicinamibacteria bacterium]|nr:serine/threonine-protein kinase [Vicinamibacteria bacterium]
MEGPTQPARIGRYEIRGEFGRGMMGVVYEAHDPALGRTIALKTIRLALAPTDREREDFERRFLAEARIAARLAHPGIVVVHDVGRDAAQGMLYIALEHLQGRTLADRVAEGPLEWRDALRLVGRVADALRYAHAQGVIHRDVKPANIMVLPSGEPKIMDFGIAKLEASNYTSPGQFFGTPLYMSPEQALGQPVDARTDLFSLGSVAYLLLAGRPPFEAPNVPGILTRVAYQHAKPLAEIGREIPADAEYVVARAMAKDPGDRYGDGRMMAEDVEDVLAGRPPRHRGGWTAPEAGEGTLVSTAGMPPARPPAPVAAARPVRRRPWRTRLVLVALLAATTAVYFYVRPGDARFWRRIVAAVRQAAVVQEAETLWSDDAGARPPAPAPAAPPPVPSPAAAVVAPTLAALGDEPADAQPAPGAEAESGADPSPSPDAREPGRLAIEFEHHLCRGNLQIWVDGAPVFDEDFGAQATRRILALKLRRGVVQEVLALPPGRHEVTVQVRWDDNVKTSRISGTFAPGATRRLDVAVARIGGRLSLDWK